MTEHSTNDHSNQIIVFDGKHEAAAAALTLTSSISLNILSEKHQRPKNIVILVDDSSYLRCLNNQRYLGQANLHDPLTVRELKQQFEEYWDHSTADVTTRRLHL